LSPQDQEEFGVVEFEKLVGVILLERFPNGSCELLFEQDFSIPDSSIGISNCQVLRVAAEQFKVGFSN
jgi:hypothetical protein